MCVCVHVVTERDRPRERPLGGVHHTNGLHGSVQNPRWKTSTAKNTGHRTTSQVMRLIWLKQIQNLPCVRTKWALLQTAGPNTENFRCMKSPRQHLAKVPSVCTLSADIDLNGRCCSPCFTCVSRHARLSVTLSKAKSGWKLFTDCSMCRCETLSLTRKQTLEAIDLHAARTLLPQFSSLKTQ